MEIDTGAVFDVYVESTFRPTVTVRLKPDTTYKSAEAGHYVQIS
jgi:hypothetical protein